MIASWWTRIPPRRWGWWPAPDEGGDPFPVADVDGELVEDIPGRLMWGTGLHPAPVPRTRIVEREVWPRGGGLGIPRVERWEVPVYPIGGDWTYPS